MPFFRYGPLLILIFLVALMTGCGGSDKAPDTSYAAHLYQAALGDEPVIRMGWGSDTFPDSSDVVCWIVYRGTYAGFPAENYNLIDVRNERTLKQYDDARPGVTDVDFTQDFTYLNYGEMADGSVDITYSRASLLSGQTYYYRARRVVEPNRGSIPLGTAAASTFTVTPSNALSDASVSQGPVTFFYAPTVVRPLSGANTINPNSISFEWNTINGADEYIIRIYKGATTTGTPIVQSPVQRPFGTSGNWIYNPSTSSLSTGTLYTWLVCARRSGEAEPVCGTESGWVKSASRQFTTTLTPPPTP